MGGEGLKGPTDVFMSGETAREPGGTKLSADDLAAKEGRERACEQYESHQSVRRH